MRLALRTVIIISLMSLIIFVTIQAYATYPTSFGNKYPPALFGKKSSVVGQVTTSINGTVGVGGAYVAIVNSSNVSQEYCNTTTDAYGNFQITGVNATYSSRNMSGSPAVGDGSYWAGRSAYLIYANKSPFGEGYSEPFSVGSDLGDGGMATVYLPGPQTLYMAADRLAIDMNGTNYVKIYAYVLDNAGNPVTNGTMVDFAIRMPGWTYANGGLNSNNSQHASAVTSNGIATVNYGWFIGNKIPERPVKITATVRDFTGAGSTLDLFVLPSPTINTMPASASTRTADATPKATSLPPAIVLFSLLAGAAIRITRKNK